MDTKNMIAVKITGMSSRINEQYEKHEKFVARDFFYFLPHHLQKLKGADEKR